jgi:alpha/beta superfamily hydrolase
MRLRLIPLLAIAILLTACGSPVASVPAPTPQAAPEPRIVTFAAEDGVVLNGTLYGRGRTAVVLSHMSDGSQAEWAGFARVLAERGYMAFPFDFRGRGDSGGSFDPPAAPVDLRAAVAFARSEGAASVVLVGASMGAMASAKVAAVEKPTAVVMIAGTTSWSGLEVSDAELGAIAPPKLVISSERDEYISGTLHLYDASPEPREKYIYPGDLHGTELFREYGDDLTQRLLRFIEEHAPIG